MELWLRKYFVSWILLLRANGTLSTFTSTLSICPSDSASQNVATGSSESINSPTPSFGLLIQPVNWPSNYPQEILWNREDLQSCPKIKLSPQNRSRPPVHQCLWTETGTIISDSQWINIRNSANTVIHEILEPIMQDSPTEMIFHRRHLKTKWRGEWEQAVAKLEAWQPLLRLCSLHWKADLVLGHAFGLSVGKSNKKMKTVSTVPPESTALSPPLTDPLPSPPPQTAPSSPERAPSPLPPINAALTMSPLKFSKHKADLNSPAAIVKKRRKSMSFLLAIVHFHPTPSASRLQLFKNIAYTGHCCVCNRRHQHKQDWYLWYWSWGIVWGTKR